MANYIQNDRGKWVVAVGAPASIARAEVEWPKLIEEIEESYCQGADEAYAEGLIRNKGVRSVYEIEAILYHTLFRG